MDKLFKRVFNMITFHQALDTGTHT